MQRQNWPNENRPFITRFGFSKLARGSTKIFASLCVLCGNCSAAYRARSRRVGDRRSEDACVWRGGLLHSR
jgi:hypothetical protein